MERLWAGWRGEYVEGADNAEGCVLCRVLEGDEYVLWRGRSCAAILNAYPYTSGHLMVLPVRHVGEIEALSDDESRELWRGVHAGVVALKAAYAPHGLNIGANLGRVAGAGVPGHFHVHALPRWDGDTNFMTSVAETRVLPEALSATFDKVRAAWPGT
ncbi:MAG: HIT domain-containing protein [Actinobacteria bacterium]|nr:HIT domain-containing protein [Actinomycetota bacterium]